MSSGNDQNHRNGNNKNPSSGSALKSSQRQGERIAKHLARAGLCSRREAERWIEAGRVAVGGKVLNSPAYNVFPGDSVTVDGRPIPEKQPPRLWRFHKPAGLVTSAKDEKGRKTVFDILPENMPRVMSVGRLDLPTEGLLLLTNDGELARYLELPSTGWIRRYRVRVYGHVTQEKLDTLKNGITVDGVKYGPIEASLDVAERERSSANRWLEMALREGKNREIRKVLGHLGLEVSRLIRVSYGPFQLGSLDKGAVEEVKTSVMKEQVAGYFGAAKGDMTGRAKSKPRKRRGVGIGAKKNKKTTHMSERCPDTPEVHKPRVHKGKNRQKTEEASAKSVRTKGKRLPRLRPQKTRDE